MREQIFPFTLAQISPPRRFFKRAAQLLAILAILIMTPITTSTSVHGMGHGARVPVVPAQPAPALAPDAGVSIKLDVNNVIGQTDPRAFGLTIEDIRQDNSNSAYFYRSVEGKSKLQELGTYGLFYSTDRDDWQHLYDDFTALPLSYPSALDTPEYLNLNGAIGSEPVIAVNITVLCQQTNPNLPPSSDNVTCQNATPDMAKSWVRYINQQSVGTPKVKYVAMGVEPYAGCDYWLDPTGLNCTMEGGHHKVSLTATEYATRVQDWAKALKALDSSIKIGVQLQPNSYSCETGPCDRSWDETVLRQDAKYVDFVMVHQYFVIDHAAEDEADAQKYSYYQQQTDIRVRKQGVTAMPKQIRKELVKWLPAKPNIPIFVPEFNAARADVDEVDDAMNMRQSLYAGFSIGELFLDLLQPVKVQGTRYSGASRVFLHHLYYSIVMLASYEPLDALPQTMIFTPGWHTLSALKDFSGKNLLAPKINNGPSTAVGLPALRAYAVKSKKDIWLAVFNHDDTNSITTNIQLTGASPASATVVEVGKSAASFLTQNNLSNPTAIGPSDGTVPASQFTASAIQNFVFAPHTMTVLHIQVH